MEVILMKKLAVKVLIAIGVAAYFYFAMLVGGIAFGDNANHYFWQTLRDGAVDVCSDERFDWIDQTIEDGWGIQVKHNCEEPDLIVTFEDEIVWKGRQACGLAEWGNPCEVTLSLWCHEWFDNDVPEITLLHEFGHCAGYAHVEDRESVMQPTAAYMPTDEDIKIIYDHYGLTVGIVPEPKSGQWTMARWSGPPTDTEDLVGVEAIYHLDENGNWMRYIDGVLNGVNTLTRLQPDQPILVMGR